MLILAPMLTADARRHFSPSALARILNINPSAIYQWRELVPEGSARILASRFPGLLEFDESVYAQRREAIRLLHKRPRKHKVSPEGGTVEGVTQDLTPASDAQAACPAAKGAGGLD